MACTKVKCKSCSALVKQCKTVNGQCIVCYTQSQSNPQTNTNVSNTDKPTQ